jgi:hypothetical protein
LSLAIVRLKFIKEVWLFEELNDVLDELLLLLTLLQLFFAVNQCGSENELTVFALRLLAFSNAGLQILPVGHLITLARRVVVRNTCINSYYSVMIRLVLTKAWLSA